MTIHIYIVVVCLFLYCITTICKNCSTTYLPFDSVAAVKDSPDSYQKLKHCVFSSQSVTRLVANNSNTTVLIPRRLVPPTTLLARSQTQYNTAELYTGSSRAFASVLIGVPVFAYFCFDWCSFMAINTVIM